jgi:hypothetical protein
MGVFFLSIKTILEGEAISLPLTLESIMSVQLENPSFGDAINGVYRTIIRACMAAERVAIVTDEAIGLVQNEVTNTSELQKARIAESTKRRLDRQKLLESA